MREAKQEKEKKKAEAKRKKEKDADKRQKDADKRDKQISLIVSSLGLASSSVAPRLALSLLDDFLKRPINQENLPHKSEEAMWETIKEYYKRSNPQGGGSALDVASKKWHDIKERADKKAAKEQERLKEARIKHRCTALDRMFDDFVGLEEVKLEALKIYDSVRSSRQTGEKIKALNYIFYGNPGMYLRGQYMKSN